MSSNRRDPFQRLPLILPRTALALLAGVLLASCTGRERQPDLPSAASASRTTATPRPSATRISFREVARPSGIAFTQGHGGRTPLNILETAGHGCGLLDVDGDGWLDVLLVGQPRCALYRNRGLVKGAPVFEEITAAAGLSRKGFWMGCATGDYDNDGRVDLLLTGYRCAALLRNEGGTFRDVSDRIPLVRSAWSSSATFFDADRDGWLDLYIAAYLRFDRSTLQLCDFHGVRAACPPTYYDPEFGRFYRNTGNGRFVDQTARFGLDTSHGKTLGVAAADADGDGWTDLYLANDGMPGDLFQNRRSRFANVGMESGTAFNYASREQAGMGVDWGDYDGDGRLDLVVTTFQYEPTSLYRNRGASTFMEEAFRAGIGDPTLNRLGFGTRFFDADSDGDLDLIQVNGHVQDNAARMSPGVTYAQPTLLFENQGEGRFTDVTATAGEALLQPIVGRGVATGDLDNDGDLDALISNLEGAPLLLLNQSQGSRHLTLRLEGRRSPRDGTGARVTVRAGGRQQVREAGTGGSYLSASDPRVHFGLGSSTTLDSLTIRWPSGLVQTLRSVPAGRSLTITEGAPLAGAAGPAHLKSAVPATTHPRRKAAIGTST